MKLVELTEFLIKNIISDPDMVSVKQIAEDEEYVTIEVLVNESVMGSVIGRQGNIANAIRTVIQAASYANGLKKVRINFDSF